MKKARIILLTVCWMTVLCIVCSAGETLSSFEITAGEEWSWESGSYNTFQGTLDLSGLTGKELTIVLSTDLPSEKQGDTVAHPVFTVVNGKRITVLNQTDTVVFTPDENDSLLDFTGGMYLPQKQRVNHVTFQIRAVNQEAGISEAFSCTFSSSDQGSPGKGSFYIPYDITRITALLFITAALIWGIVIFFSRRFRHKNRIGD